MDAGVAPPYHHSQGPTGGHCVSHPYHSRLCRVRGPVPQRRCTLPRGTAFFDSICNLLNAEPLILFSLRHKQGITSYTSTAHDWTMFAVQKLHVWDPLYIWFHHYFIRCLGHERIILWFTCMFLTKLLNYLTCLPQRLFPV